MYYSYVTHAERYNIRITRPETSSLTSWLKRVKEPASATADGSSPEAPQRHSCRASTRPSALEVPMTSGNDEGPASPDASAPKKSPEEQATETAAPMKEGAEKKALAKKNAIKLEANEDLGLR
ncbi:hypothetical protein B0H14DRAFT_3441323 [Mycena olivaceomarginata]|nr:hypothetical protein B0H14DRAFT_3441323 [Mycena olivaceomarginata]